MSNNPSQGTPLDYRKVAEAFSDWSWNREGEPIGFMIASDAARLSFHAGAQWAASQTPLSSPQSDDDWRDDPSADERWSAGLDYGMVQLCAVLNIDPKKVNWDAATETLDGDVCAAISNVFRVKYGDDFDPTAPAPSPVGIADEAALLLETLNAVRIMMKNRDRSSHEERIYNAVHACIQIAEQRSPAEKAEG